MGIEELKNKFIGFLDKSKITFENISELFEDSKFPDNLFRVIVEKRDNIAKLDDECRELVCDILNDISNAYKEKESEEAKEAKVVIIFQNLKGEVEESSDFEYKSYTKKTNGRSGRDICYIVGDNRVIVQCGNLMKEVKLKGIVIDG